MSPRSSRFLRSSPTLAGAALLSFALAACDGESPTQPPEEHGTVEAVVRDDPGASGSSAAMSPARAFASGEFEATARIQVQVDGVWRDLDGLAAVDVRAEIQGGEETVGSATVEARTYERARVVLTDARTHLDGETQIGVGPIGVAVTLSIGGGGEVVVESTQPLTVQANGTTRLVLDLNSHVWVDEGAVDAGAVSRSSFESAAALRVN
jgi:hypothetical protein